MCSVPVGAGECSLGFTEWLCGVCERINQTMHFQCTGTPEPLVFHIPQSLHKRMSLEEEGQGCGKMRLPNKTCTFTRTGTSPPLGEFTIHTWHIHSLPLLYKIFNTHLNRLQIMKYYKQNGDGTYTEIPLDSREDQVNDNVRTPFSVDSNTKVLRIAPGKLFTFLKVGTTSHDPHNKVPFTIQWIPNILPISKVGELRIKFEFGHRSR